MTKKLYVIFLIFNIATISAMTSTITAYDSKFVKNDQSLLVKEQENNCSFHNSNIPLLNNKTLSEITPMEQLRNEYIFRYIWLEKTQVQKYNDIYRI